MKIIKDQTFKDRALFIEEDDVVLDNCKFTGTPRDATGKIVEAFIMANNYSNLSILRCSLYEIVGDAISLRSTNGSSRTFVGYNKIWNVSGNGIISKEGNYWVEIFRNTFLNVGKDINGERHPIYAKSPDILIDGNLITGTSGNGISVRSSGKVINNIIQSSGKSNVRYFNDGQPGPSDILTIANNQCALPGDGYAAISLLYTSAITGKMVSRYEVANNEIIGSALPFFASPEFEGRYEYTAFEDTKVHQLY